MSEIQEIDVFIAPDGTVKLEVRGVSGPKCLSLTEQMEALLGGRAAERTLTDEYHRQEEGQAQDDVLEQRSR